MKKSIPRKSKLSQGYMSNVKDAQNADQQIQECGQRSRKLEANERFASRKKTEKL